MNKWIFTLSLMGVLAVGANADVIEHVPPTLIDGCYQIENAGQLFGFADIVNGIPADAENGIEEVPAQPNVCGKLVNDIRVVAVDATSANGNHVVLDDLSGANVPQDNHWTPMVNFAGTFDGQGHTISGLYYSGSNAGFFASLTGNATVKRLSINDSYFASDDNAGGFVAFIGGDGATVSMEECNFIGLVQTITHTEQAAKIANIGGFIGIIQNTLTSFTMKSCANEGNINPGISDGNTGGFIGTVSGGLENKMTFKDCFSYGFVGGKGQRGFVGNAQTDQNFVTRENIYCYGTGKYCKTTECSKEDPLLVCKDKLKRKIVFDLTNLKTPFKGMTFEFNEAGHIIIAHITEWENTETQTVLQELSIPQTVIADSVTFDRIFNGSTATVMLPFDIAPSNVTNADGSPIKFITVPSLEKVDGKWTAKATTESGSINAHTPYLVESATGEMHFHGPVTLNKNDTIIVQIKGSDKKIKQNEYESVISSSWSLVGTYKTMNTTTVSDANVKDTTSEYVKESNLGKIYGFVGTEGVSDNGYNFTLGEFAVAGHNVRTREMRAYLIYKEPVIQAMASPNGTIFRAAATPVEELPSRIPVIYNPKTVIPVGQFVDPTLKTTKVVATIKTDIPEIECEKDCEESTTAITKPFTIPMKASKIDRWQDAMGRHLNGKPTKHGTYFKNGIPVIIK